MATIHEVFSKIIVSLAGYQGDVEKIILKFVISGTYGNELAHAQIGNTDIKIDQRAGFFSIFIDRKQIIKDRPDVDILEYIILSLLFEDSLNTCTKNDCFDQSHLHVAEELPLMMPKSNGYIPMPTRTIFPPQQRPMNYPTMNRPNESTPMKFGQYDLALQPSPFDFSRKVDVPTQQPSFDFSLQNDVPSESSSFSLNDKTRSLFMNPSIREPTKNPFRDHQGVPIAHQKNDFSFSPIEKQFPDQQKMIRPLSISTKKPDGIVCIHELRRYLHGGNSGCCNPECRYNHQQGAIKFIAERKNKPGTGTVCKGEIDSVTGCTYMECRYNHNATSVNIIKNRFLGSQNIMHLQDPPKNARETRDPPKNAQEIRDPPKNARDAREPLKNAREIRDPPKNARDSRDPPKNASESHDPPKNARESKYPLKKTRQFMEKK